MISTLILVAVSAGEVATAHHHFPFNPYAQSSLHGPPCCPGGWGLPYCGYYPWHGWENGHPPGPEGPIPGPHAGAFGAIMLRMPPGSERKDKPPVDNKKKEEEAEKKEKEDEKKKDDENGDKKKDDEKQKNDGKEDDDKKGPKLDDLASARVEIRLPEGAKLYVDGQLIANAVDGEVFYTPRLARGKEYVYEVRVEVVHDAKKETLSKRIRVMAGSSIRADFMELKRDTGVAQSNR